MSLYDCIQRAIDSGDLPPKRAREAQALFTERLQAHASAGPAAANLAAEDVWLTLRRQHIRRKRQVLMQADAQLRILDQVTRHREPDGSWNAASALRQLVEWGQSATHQSVEGIRQALEGSYLRDIGEFIADHQRNIFGRVRSKAGLRNVVRELKGEATGDPRARLVADAVRKTIERARREFNAAGGEIAKMEGYDLPHHWDRKKIGAVPADTWAARLHDEMDWDRILDRATEKPFSQSGREARMHFLVDVHEGIRTGGWNRREPSGLRAGRSLAKSRVDHRVLHFKTADGWMKINDEFGTADPFAAVVEHLKAMARDTAQMRVLGPNPSAGLEFARQTALRLANERPWKPSSPISAGEFRLTYSDAAAEVRGVGEQAQRMLAMVSGAANAPEMDLFANFMAGVRHWLIASQLGGAMLSAVSDVGFMGMASRHVGMDPKQVLTRMAKTLALPENRRIMLRAGIIAESAASTGVVQARLMGEAYGPPAMAQLSEFTLRASGLTAWTDISRGVFKLEFYGLLAENAGRAFDQIDAPLRELVFEARGITAADWDIIRATGLHRDAAEPDATFLIPDDIRRRADLDPDQALELSLKLQSAIQEQVEFAVPSASLRGRATMQVGAPGTIGGEILRSALMYKNFTLSLMYNQLGRVLFHKVRGNRLGNVVMFALATTAAGGLAMQLKEIAKGRDPHDMTTGTFWKAAMIQGGGLGIFGDFLYSTENRFGGGFGSTVAGPVVGLIDRTAGLTGAINRALTEPDPEKKSQRWDAAQREAIRFANQFSGPTNLWYMNTAFDRMVWDGLQEWLDPGAAEAFARAEKKRVNEYGNRSYAPPGGGLRMPDLSSIYGYGGAP